ncbi:MAG: DUF3883 domain-containing protein [Prevotellaceae bacterium]|jgi:hypothetical protein|nr:DUF3883 domain-containing protein [Prevotellaceae bacterium]
MTFSSRDKQILIGLFLSKFDRKGLDALGFSGFMEAYNTLGLAIGAKPLSLRNYRDEFDPYFPNPRRGWQRPMKEYCRTLYDCYSSLKFDDFHDLVKTFLIPNYDVEQIIEKIEKIDKTESIAKRLITGKSAEEYFKIHYTTINQFKEYELKDTTNLACGFDFKLSHQTNFYCVEVKGVNLNTGSVMMTEKEFFVAGELKQQYCLFVVMNFIEKPYHQLFFDPLNCRLDFKKIERNVTQTNYLTTIAKPN